MRNKLTVVKEADLHLLNIRVVLWICIDIYVYFCSFTSQNLSWAVYVLFYLKKTAQSKLYKVKLNV